MPDQLTGDPALEMVAVNPFNSKFEFEFEFEFELNPFPPLRAPIRTTAFQ